MSSGHRWWWLAAVCAVTMVVAGVVYSLITLGVVGSPEPAAGAEVDRYLADYLSYRRDSFPYELVANGFLVIGAVAFGVLLLTGRLLGVLRDDPLGEVSSVLAFSRSLVFAVTQAAYLGSLDAVLEASTVDAFDRQHLGTLTQVIDRTDDYVENLGMLMIAAALPGLRMTQGGPAGTWLRWTTAALAVGLVLIVVASFSGGAWGDVLLVVIAVVLVPAASLILGERLRHAA